jgi:DNA-binding beta-propeller fold protein YncE
MRAGLCLLTIVVVMIAAFAFFPGSRNTPAVADPSEVLRTVADVPLTGPAVRFDYQSLDPTDGRLYIAHMNADQLVVFDTNKREVVATLDGFHRVHGVIVVPEIDRIFASITGDHHVGIVDRSNLKMIAEAGDINYPDGLAYAPPAHRVFVSDEHGNVDVVIDGNTNSKVTAIPLGDGAGNTVYDSVAERILVAVHGKNELVTIDPLNARIEERTALPALDNPHGIALDPENHLAFVAGEGNHKLVIVDLNSRQVSAPFDVGRDPDVLAFDNSAKRLYVAAESGHVTVFQEAHRTLQLLGEMHMPHAHTVAVDQKTHLVYLPLENLDGKPVLRIMEFAGAAAP